jgi:hypothetical protein
MGGFRKAERKKAKLRLGLVGPSGSGKTYSALLVAFGLGGRVALIDTENGSGDMYSHLGEYDIWNIEAPYTVQKYLDAITMGERAGYNVLIIDSLSHAWAGEGGLLDQQGKIADSSASKNSYNAWRMVTPLHYKLIEAMLTSKCHIIATMRAKTEYTQEKDDKTGKTIIRKLGMAPVQREGMDYEFTLVFDLDAHHNVLASKDRTSIFDGQVIRLSQETGETLRAWLDSGVEAPLPPQPPTMPSEAPQAPKRMENTSEPQKSAPVPSMKGRMKNIWIAYLEVCGGQKDHAQNAILAVTEGRGSQEWTPQDIEFLEGDLLRRQQERNAPATFGESVRDSDPEGIALAESKGIGPDLDEKPVTLEATPPPPKFASEAETLRARLIDTLTAGGWTLEEADTWIQENFRKQLKQLTKDELRAAISKANDELDARDGIKEAI